MLLGWLLATAALAGDTGARPLTDDERLERLEAENAEMKRRLNALAEAYEGLGDPDAQLAHDGDPRRRFSVHVQLSRPLESLA